MAAHYTVGAINTPRYDREMNWRLSLAGFLLMAATGTACSGASSDSFPRATRAPDVRCMTPAPSGSPGQDPNSQPMFFLFCMQSP
jgi:hypothetical protein